MSADAIAVLKISTGDGSITRAVDMSSERNQSIKTTSSYFQFQVNRFIH